ncbi:MAG: retroviral-like aspartic protease family protein [Bacteroidales bacterium]|jgi:hypothetical protein|nr:retroviral-like aspartic protease family protein [Bacteroidales bacterium]
MKIIVPLEIIMMGDVHSYHLFVKGSVNGVACNLLVDTGASRTVFDLSLIPEIADQKDGQPQIQSSGIYAGEIKSSFGVIRKFKMEGLKLKDWQVVLIDLSYVNETYGRFSKKRVAGLIGSDFLFRHKAIVDYKRKRLVLKQ